MALQRFAQFIGKPRNAVIVSGMITAGVLSIKATPHMFPSQTYRPLVEAYKSGHKMQLTDTQKSEFNEVCADFGLHPGTKYRTFATSRWEVASRGLPWLPNNVHVGIPVILTEDPSVTPGSFSELIRSAVDTEDGRTFANSLRLSKNGRKFALAREVAKIRSNRPVPSVLLAPALTIGSFIGVFVAGLYVPLPVLGNVVLVGTCTVFIYQFLTGVLNERADMKADDDAAKLGTEYVRGGVEFYEKAVQRNKGLRKLMGRRGERLYTYYGNRNSGWVYSAGASNTQQLEMFRKKLAQIDNLIE